MAASTVARVINNRTGDIELSKVHTITVAGNNLLQFAFIDLVRNSLMQMIA